MRAVTIATAIAVCIATSAAAQQNCGLRAVIISNLIETYGERQMFAARSENGSMIEIWGNDEKDTWTALIVRADGTACMVDSGRGIATVAPAGLRL